MDFPVWHWAAVPAVIVAILVFVGGKMLLLDVFKVPIWFSLTVIAACLTIAGVASLRAARSQGPRPDGAAPGAPGDEHDETTVEAGGVAR